MTLWLLSVILACLLAACSQTEQRTPAAAPAPAAAPPSGAPPRASQAAARPRIVFLGDSLTSGLGLPPEQAVPALVQDRLDREGYDYEVVNAGVSGDTSAGGLSRLDWSLEGDVKVLVVELGGNDGLRGLPPAALKRNLAEIITRAKARGIRVLLTGMESPPSFGAAYTGEFRRVFRDLADEHDIALMPFFLEGVAVNAALNQRDGIHPNAEGARVIERNLWRSLEPLLDQE